MWGGSRAHVLRSARANGKQAKKDKNLNLKTKLFPSSEQKSDDFTAETRPLRFRDKSQNSNPTRFRLRVRIELFQQKDSYLILFICNSSKLSSALSAYLLTLATLGSESRRIIRKEKCILLAFGTPRRALSRREK